MMYNKHEKTVEVLIKNWAKKKKSFLSLQYYKYEIEKWKNLTGISNVSSILEIGSGSGLFLLVAVSTGFAKEGLGIEPCLPEEGTELEEFQETMLVIEKLGLSNQVRFYNGTLDAFFEDAFSSDYINKKYDLLVFRNSLHHIYPRMKNSPIEDLNIQKFIHDLSKLKNFLNKTSYIYIVEVTRPSKIFSTVYNLYRTSRGACTIDWTSKRTQSEWCQLLEKAGFSVVGKTWLSTPHPFFSRIPILNKVLSPQFLISAVNRG